MFCPNCGSGVPDGANVCPSCGTNLTDTNERAATTQIKEGDTQVAPVPSAVSTDTSSDVEPKNKGSKKSRVRIIAIVAVLLLGLIAAGVRFSRNSSLFGSSNIDQVVQSDTSADDDDKEPSFAGACIDENGNITLYGLLTLDGEDLRSLLEQQDFEWSNSDTCWLRDTDSSAVAYMNADGDELYSRREMMQLGIAAADASGSYIDSVAGYDSLEDAYKGCVNVDVEDEIVDDDFVCAKVSCEGISYLVAGFVHTNGADEEDGTYDFMALSDSAIKDGMINSILGIDVGASVDEVWGVISTAYSLDADSIEETLENV